MQTTVQDLLKQDLPPTNASAKRRREHTLGNIVHNLRHSTDHGDDLLVDIQKLHTVDSKKAHSEAERVVSALEEKVNKIKDWLEARR